MLKTISDKEMDEIKRIVRNLPAEKKMEVLSILEEELFAMRFKTLLNEFRESAKKYPVTLDEITKEMEHLRQKGHESGR